MPQFTPFSFLLADRARNLVLSPWHPHRRLTERPEPIAAYHARLGNLYAHSLYGDHKAMEKLVGEIVGNAAVVEGRRTGGVVIDGYVDVLAGLLDQNKLQWDFLFPKLNPSHVRDDVYGLGLRRQLDDLEPLLVHEAALRAVFKTVAANLLTGFTQYVLPRSAFASDDGDEPKSIFSVPLIDFVAEPASLVQAVMMVFVGADDHNHDPITYRTFNATRTQLFENLLAASQLSLDQANKNPQKIILPEDSSLTSTALAEAYLAKTPLLALLTLPVPFTVPRDLYTEHTAIFAPSGHGKTQLLQTIIYEFLNEPDPPAMFIVDSQGDMLRKLEALDFPHRDRLVILDPEADPPPQLNFLDFKGTNQAAIDELFGYLMSSLSRDLTAKQGTAVSYLLRLMRAIPGATIDTLRQVMENKTPHPAIAQLDPLTQDFFRNQFYNPSAMGATRQQVAGRLYTLLSNETFKAMFAAPINSFDAAAAMREKKIVLINTSQLLLREASAVLGRYFIAQVLSAAYGRVTIRNEKDRHLALLIVDEAAQYFDDYTETILSQSRKFGLGLIAATQFVEQMPDRVKAAVSGGTAIKYAGPVSQKDARFLAPEMFTTPEFIHAMKKRSASTDFAVHVRGLTAQALRLTVPLGIIEGAARHQGSRIDRPQPSDDLPPSEPTEAVKEVASDDFDDDPYKATKLT